MTEPAQPVDPIGAVVGPGESLPAGIITKAKAIAALLSNLVALASSAAVLNLVPEEHRGKVLAVCAVITVVVNGLAVYWTTPTVVQPITVLPPPAK